MQSQEQPAALPAPRRSAPTTANRVARSALAWAVLSAGIAASLLASWQVQRAVEGQARARFIGACDEVAARIRGRLTAYSLMLRGGRALMAASEEVTRGEWKAYYEALDAERTVPGYLAIGFAEFVRGPDLGRHVDRVRRDGLVGYRVHPAEANDAHAPVVFVEPFDGPNLRASGFDMFAEPVRRSAMQLACDTGHAALTAGVTLVQEAQPNGDPGAILFVPVFRKGSPTTTPHERREALAGWIFCSYRIAELMLGVIPDWLNDGGMGLVIYDGDTPLPDTVLFASHPHPPEPSRAGPLNAQRTIDFNGRRWLLVFTGVAGRSDTAVPTALMTGAAGVLISGLVFWLILTAFRRSDAQRRAEDLAEQVSEMAFHDSLTGLPNRLLLLDRLEVALAACNRSGGYGALMMVDLDNFKPLNDSVGHAAGDFLLVEVARRLEACIRRTDTVARLGGDEFIVLLTGLTGGAAAALHEASGVAENILGALCQPYPIVTLGKPPGEIEHRCSSSIGVTLFHHEDADPDAVLRRADAAMYAAKRAGRNRVWVDEAGGAACCAGA